LDAASEYLKAPEIYMIATGILMGTIARLVNLKVSFRQMPTYPSAYFNSIILGFVASALGAIAIPAILAKDFAAVTFLAVAVQMFREVRITERDSLSKLEHTEYVQRGEAYIDGIAKTFESKYYISLLTALSTVLAIKIISQPTLPLRIIAGIIVGFITMYLCSRFMKGKTVSHICIVKLGRIEVRGSELYVDEMFVTNYLGTDRARELFIKEGLAVVLEPRDPASRITLENYGQRQAILFEAVRTLGVKRYKFIRRNFKSGKVIIAFVPIINDPDKLIMAISRTPILESSRKVKRLMKTDFGG